MLTAVIAVWGPVARGGGTRTSHTEEQVGVEVGVHQAVVAIMATKAGIGNAVAVKAVPEEVST